MDYKLGDEKFGYRGGRNMLTKGTRVVVMPGSRFAGETGTVIEYFPSFKKYYIKFDNWCDTHPFLLYKESQLCVNYSDYARRSILSSFGITKVIFSDPCTIVIWADKTKTVVRTQNGEKFDPEKGLAMAIAKKALGNKGSYFDVFKWWIKEEDYPEELKLDTVLSLIAERTGEE